MLGAVEFNHHCPGHSYLHRARVAEQLQDILLQSGQCHHRFACLRPSQQQAFFGSFRLSSNFLMSFSRPQMLCRMSSATTSLVVGNADGVYALTAHQLRLGGCALPHSKSEFLWILTNFLCAGEVTGIHMDIQAAKCGFPWSKRSFTSWICCNAQPLPN